MKIIPLMILGCAALLTACTHHENPLSTLPREDVGKFLAKAAFKAEVALKVDKGHGYYYGKCMMQEPNLPVDCDAIYQAMQHYAETQPQPIFQTITVQDLTEPKSFYRIKEDYQGSLFWLDPTHE